MAEHSITGDRFRMLSRSAAAIEAYADPQAQAAHTWLHYFSITAALYSGKAASKNWVRFCRPDPPVPGGYCPACGEHATADWTYRQPSGATYRRVLRMCPRDGVVLDAPVGWGVQTMNVRVERDGQRCRFSGEQVGSPGSPFGCVALVLEAFGLEGAIGPPTPWGAVTSCELSPESPLTTGLYWLCFVSAEPDDYMSARVPVWVS